MSFWARVTATLRRWFGREPAPAFYLDGHAGLLPRRAYRLYVPKGASRWRRMPAIVLLHGCKQTPDDIVKGTRFEALADRMGTYLLLPRQSEVANPYRCWNWFDGATASGHGEAAVVMKMMHKALRWRRKDKTRTAAVGISAGGALASILGIHHGDDIRAVASVAGIAAGAVASPLTALTVMKRGPETDVAQVGRLAYDVADGQARHVPLLAIHGRHDDVVTPRHALSVARQFLARNGVEVPDGSDTSLPDPDHARQESPVRGRGFQVREWERDGTLAVRLVEIDDLGHAWSGGDGRFAFHEAGGPDATAMIGAFLEQVWPAQ